MVETLESAIVLDIDVIWASPVVTTTGANLQPEYDSIWTNAVAGPTRLRVINSIRIEQSIVLN